MSTGANRGIANTSVRTQSTVIARTRASAPCLGYSQEPKWSAFCSMLLCLALERSDDAETSIFPAID